MTLQTTTPLVHTSLDASHRQVLRLARTISEGDVDLNPPYQRGEKWTRDQQRLLFRSMLLGVPVPAIILNDRHASGMASPDEPSYAVIDGKQRLLACVAWLDDDLDLPASWFKPEDVAVAVDTPDGPYVTRSGLTVRAERLMHTRCTCAVATAQVPTIKDEAEIFLLVNRAGTPMDDEDYAAAEAITAAAAGPSGE